MGEVVQLFKKAPPGQQCRMCVDEEWWWQRVARYEPTLCDKHRLVVLDWIASQAGPKGAA